MSTVSKRTVTETRHEYVVPAPAAAAELQKAINWAMSEMPANRRGYDDCYTVEARDYEILAEGVHPSTGRQG